MSETKHELEEQLRILEGQGALNKWQMRMKALEEDTERYAAWLEYDDGKAPSGLGIGMRADLEDALKTLRRALEHSRARVDGLQEFAHKKGKKK